jgi:hypothetical protein
MYFEFVLARMLMSLQQKFNYNLHIVYNEKQLLKPYFIIMRSWEICLLYILDVKYHSY